MPMMQENCQEFPSGMPKRAMPIRESNRDGKTGVLACLGKQASSLFLICPSVLKCQTTESHIIMTASITILEMFSRRFRDGHRFAFFFLRYYLNHYVFLLL